jgi:hypothetical protein
MYNQPLGNKRRILIRTACSLVMVIASAGSGRAQHERGAIRLKVRDLQGGPLVVSVGLVSEANQVHRSFFTDRRGNYVAQELPFGLYRLEVTHPGFLPLRRFVRLRSEVPVSVSVTLGLAPVRSSIDVTDSGTLIDPESAGTVYSAGPQVLSEQLSAQMDRGVTDAVNSMPGWLYEANGVLHPRGSEYDVQFVVNGLPLTENRSPAFAPPLAADEVQSMRVMTAGFPAEYGRKLGGVVEVTTVRDLPSGLHMSAAAQGGNFATASGGVEMGYARGANEVMISGNAGVTDRYLDPPVIANYTNHGSSGSSAAMWSRDLTQRDTLRVSVRHAEARHTVPNELVQQQAGQRQDAADSETSFQADYSRVLSPALLFSAEGSLRDESFRLWANSLSTPVVIGQRRGFRQGYGRMTLAGSKGIQEWKIGMDSIFNTAHENLQYAITNPSLFDPGTALRFAFGGRRTDIEPAAFVQDTVRLKNWNVSMGLRYDHYRFVVRQSAWSPRFAGPRRLRQGFSDPIHGKPAACKLLRT